MSCPNYLYQYNIDADNILSYLKYKVHYKKYIIASFATISDTSDLAVSLVGYVRRQIRSFFSKLKKLSAHALS